MAKNSWGSQTDYLDLGEDARIGYGEWGIKEDGKHTGYFWISYYDKTLNNCETMSFDTDLTEGDGYLSVWMYDYMPSTVSADENTSVQSEDLIRTANVFKNDTGIDAKLYAVSTKTANPNASVKYFVYKLNENAANPEDGTLLATVESFYEYAGFHREKLDGSITVKAGETIAIVVEESVTENGMTLYEYGVNVAKTKETAEKTGEPMYGVAVVKEDESFIYENGAWADWSKDERREALKDEYAIDNFSIKAYMIVDAVIYFTDVPEDAYYADAVKWAVEKGITNGTTDTTFSPDQSCTRSQMVTFLWRAAGSPEPSSTDNPFNDVDTDQYYGKAVLWAVEKGITTGMTPTEFGPDVTVDRAQTVTFIYRAAGSPVSGASVRFNDIDNSAYYMDAVNWAVDNNITKGTGDGLFSPDEDCTRAQIVTLLYRYYTA